MPIELKVRKIGNSYGVVLPKEALKQLNVEEGQSLYLTESPDNAYRLSSGNSEFITQMDAAEGVIRRYRNALKELAK